MKFIIVIIIACFASTFASQMNVNVQQKGLTDFIINTFGLQSVWSEMQTLQSNGLQSVWSEIQTLGSNLDAQLLSVLTQLLFAGQEKWQQAQQILNTLVYDLVNHIGNASTIVSQAITALSEILSNQNGKRDNDKLIEMLLDNLGFGNIWWQIQYADAAILAQFSAQMVQLLFCSPKALDQAKPILQNLAMALTEHYLSLSEHLSTAVAQLNQLLSNGCPQIRGLTDYNVNTFGLKSGSQLLITIQEWQQAQQILNQAILDIEMNKPATINQNGKKGLRQLVR